MTVPSALRLTILITFLACGAGCAPTGLYDWGDYELALYHFYDDPEDFDDYIGALDEIVNRSEAADRVPPGMYAEYGYLLYVSGQTGQAVTYFEREKEKWPESAKFMDMMIGNVEAETEAAPARQPDDRSPAAPAEAGGGAT